MKSKFIFGILAMTAGLYSGCDLLEKADDVTFNTTLDVIWTADENGEFTNAPYEHFETVDLTKDPQVAKYASKIKSVKVNKVTYLISDYNAAPHNSQVIFNSGVASFAATGSTIPSVVVPFGATASGVNLQTTTSETELDIDEAGLNELAAMFKEERQLVMLASGNLSVTPVSFKVVSKFYVSITASALD